MPFKTNQSFKFNIIRATLIAVLYLVFVTACEKGRDSGASSGAEPATAETYFPISLDGRKLHLQLAITQAEQQKGLMFRESLAGNHGMLFLFEQPEQRGFWMKNTSLHLDIGYFDRSGKLLEIHRLFPFDETPVASYSRNVQIAVETNRGWYAANDIKPGAQLDMTALAAALAARGFSASAFGIEIDAER